MGQMTRSAPSEKKNRLNATAFFFSLHFVFVFCYFFALFFYCLFKTQTQKIVKHNMMRNIQNPCPVCYQKFGSLLYNHKASYCKFKETKIACNLCAGEHKISECPHQQKKTTLFCDRCKRSNHATEKCFAKPCKRCGSLHSHDRLLCTQKNSEHHSRKKPRLQESGPQDWREQSGPQDWREQSASQDWREQSASQGWREQSASQGWGEQSASQDWREQNVPQQNVPQRWGEQSAPQQNVPQGWREQSAPQGWREQNVQHGWFGQNVSHACMDHIAPQQNILHGWLGQSAPQQNILHAWLGQGGPRWDGPQGWKQDSQEQSFHAFNESEVWGGACEGWRRERSVKRNMPQFRREQEIQQTGRSQKRRNIQGASRPCDFKEQRSTISKKRAVPEERAAVPEERAAGSEHWGEGTEEDDLNYYDVSDSDDFEDMFT